MYASKLNDIPDKPHWVILTPKSTYIPGDERSRTNPGHGYPAHTEYSLYHQVFLSEEEWVAEIKKLSGRKSPFRAMKVEPAKVSVSVEVSVG